jgi:hypothetical protein
MIPAFSIRTETKEFARAVMVRDFAHFRKSLKKRTIARLQPQLQRRWTVLIGRLCCPDLTA